MFQGEYAVDVLARIKKLRMEKGWTEYELAKRSGLPQSTISTWYSRNMLPSVTSLEKICNGLGITMSQFFLDESSTQTTVLTAQQLRLISYTARLDPAQYDSLLNFLSSLHPDEDPSEK